MAGNIVGGPTPWWQLPEYQGQAGNLESSAPPGYQYDKVQMKYVPIVSSATNALANQTRTQNTQDANQAMLKSAISGIGGGSGGPSTVGAPTTGTLPTIAMPGSGGGMGQMMPSSGGGVGMPGGATGGGGMPSIAGIQHVDTSAAQAAEFGHAKDQVGLESSGALTGLRSALGGRGMLGSGAESRGTMGVVEKGQGELGDVSRSQAVDRATGDRAEAAANYQGDITQRGQTLADQQARNSLASNERNVGYQGQITQRGQDVGAQTASAALAQSKQLSLMEMLMLATRGVGGASAGSY